MKKLLFVLALGAFAACGTSETPAAEADTTVAPAVVDTMAAPAVVDTTVNADTTAPAK
ncbi:MAG: hypothetical protein ABI921_08420 [Panacibacter sp.]